MPRLEDFFKTLNWNLLNEIFVEQQEEQGLSGRTITNHWIQYKVLPYAIEQGASDEVVLALLKKFSIDFLEAGNWEYGGNGNEEHLNNQYYFVNLLELACKHDRSSLIDYFIQNLEDRRLNPYVFTGYESCIDEAYSRKIRATEKKLNVMRRVFPNNVVNYELRQYLGGRKTRRGCRKHPYPWSAKALAKSPFKTRKGVHTRGFTARSSLKSMGRIPRSNGCYVIGDKYKKIFS